MSTRATATVRVVVEVKLGSTWGADCAVGQVHQQGTQQAIETLRRAIAASNGRFRLVSAEVGEITIKDEP